MLRAKEQIQVVSLRNAFAEPRRRTLQPCSIPVESSFLAVRRHLMPISGGDPFSYYFCETLPACTYWALITYATRQAMRLQIFTLEIPQ
jgi:hypothetical protein